MRRVLTVKTVRATLEHTHTLQCPPKRELELDTAELVLSPFADYEVGFEVWYGSCHHKVGLGVVDEVVQLVVAAQGQGSGRAM